MRRAFVLTALLALSCASGPPGPAALDTKNESCSWCRMAVSEVRFAGQLVAPSEEALFFDDIGCLAGYLAGSRALPDGAVAYVADHRTGTWVRAGAATYTYVVSVETPMGSHLLAHADPASRDADADAKGGKSRTPADVFGPGGPPAGGP
ncbi:MAG TPA: nitrous oxide reductase accessory protein NosL [Vicinamibacteria bacterium]